MSKETKPASSAPAWWRRLLARHHRLGLQAQLLWTMGLLMLPVCVGLTAWSVHDAGAHERSRVEAQAQALARSLSSAAATPVLTGELAQLESLLMQVAEFPEARRLTIAHEGKVLSDVVASATERPRAQFGKASATSPDPAIARQARVARNSRPLHGSPFDGGLIEARTDAVVVWTPILGAQVIGWIRVELSAEGIMADQRAALFYGALVSIMVMATALLLLNILLRRSLSPLRRAARFAARLPRAVGSTLDDEGGSQETRELRQALNFASVHLHDQYQRQHEHVAQLDTITELSSDGFAVIDNAGQLAYANPAFRLMTGCAFQGESLNGLLEGLRERLTAAAPVLQSEAWLDGKAHEYTLPFSAPADMVLHLTVRPGVGQYRQLLYVRDVSREAAIDRMKSEFLATAAHELRTPMVSIFGYTELMIKRPVREEQRKEMLEVVHRQTQRLIELVNDLLDLARIEARQGADFKRQVQPVQPLIKEAVEAIIVPGGKHSARIEVAPELPMVSVDGQQMGRVLNNLISNAVKYWPEGGEIVVAAKPSPHQGVPGVSMSVRDGGMGMSPQQLARAFERFFRADQACHIPGTGLGLSLVKEIVQLHGGTIQMDSALNEGTTVSIWLPVAREEAPATPAVSSAPASAQQAVTDTVTS